MLRIEFATDNAAFGVDCSEKWMAKWARNEEVKRVLMNVCNQLDNGYTSGSCVDINGNKIGTWTID